MAAPDRSRCVAVEWHGTWEVHEGRAPRSPRRRRRDTRQTGYPLHSSAEQLDPVLLIMMSYVAGSTAAAGSASLWKSKFLAFTQPNWSEGDTQSASYWKPKAPCGNIPRRVGDGP